MNQKITFKKVKKITGKLMNKLLLPYNVTDVWQLFVNGKRIDSHYIYECTYKDINRIIYQITLTAVFNFKIILFRVGNLDEFKKHLVSYMNHHDYQYVYINQIVSSNTNVNCNNIVTLTNNANYFLSATSSNSISTIVYDKI